MSWNAYRLGTIFLETILSPPIDEKKEPWREIYPEKIIKRRNKRKMKGVFKIMVVE